MKIKINLSPETERLISDVKEIAKANKIKILNKKTKKLNQKLRKLQNSDEERFSDE